MLCISSAQLYCTGSTDRSSLANGKTCTELGYTNQVVVAHIYHGFVEHLRGF